MSPEQLIEKMACSVMDEWGETPQGYAIQKTHAKTMLLVVLSHISEIVEIEQPSKNEEYLVHIIFKEPYRKLMEGEKHEKG